MASDLNVSRTETITGSHKAPGLILVPWSIIDFYLETNRDTYNVVHGGASPVPDWGQAITGDGRALGGCKFYLASQGSPTGTCVAKLYGHSGTFGTSSIPDGNLLATSYTYNVALLTTAYQLIQFLFPTPYTLVNGTHYVIVFEYSGGSATNCVRIGIDTSSPSHNGNSCYYTTSWTAYPTGDTCFYCFSNTPSDSTWFVQSDNDNMEHSVIVSSKVYVPALKAAGNIGGLYIYDLSDGSLLHNWVTTSYLACAPIVSGDYVYVYDHVAKTVQMVKESDGSVAHTLTGLSDIDFESMGWDTVNSRIILPLLTALRAYSMTDLSQAWTNEDLDSAGYQSGSPLVVGNYIYWKPNNGTTLYKLNLSDGTVAAQANNLGALSSTYSYGSPVYDPDHDYVYVFGTNAQVHCIKVSDMSVVWSKTVGSGMTTPRIHNSIGYHNNKLFVPCRDESANQKAKIYALDCLNNGDILWTNTDPNDNDQDVTNMLLSDDYLIVGGLSYTDIPTGSMFIINQSDGSLALKKALRYGATCGGIAAASGGKVIVNELGGFMECFTLGSGATSDSEHYMKNLYHNGYSGDRLLFKLDAQLAETLTGGDQKTSALDLLIIQAADTIINNDQPVLEALINDLMISIFDTLTANDLRTPVLDQLLIQASDAIDSGDITQSVLDTLLLSMVETITEADLPQSILSELIIQLIEAIDLADLSQSILAELLIQLLDSINSNDLPQTIFNELAVWLLDGVEVSEIPDQILTDLIIQILETITGNEGNIPLITRPDLLVQVVDAITNSDISQENLAQLIVSLFETIANSDVSSSFLTELAISILETLSSSDRALLTKEFLTLRGEFLFNRFGRTASNVTAGGNFKYKKPKDN